METTTDKGARPTAQQLLLAGRCPVQAAWLRRTVTLRRTDGSYARGILCEIGSLPDPGMELERTFKLELGDGSTVTVLASELAEAGLGETTSGGGAPRERARPTLVDDLDALMGGDWPAEDGHARPAPKPTGKGKGKAAFSLKFAAARGVVATSDEGGMDALAASLARSMASRPTTRGGFDPEDESPYPTEELGDVAVDADEPTEEPEHPEDFDEFELTADDVAGAFADEPPVQIAEARNGRKGGGRGRARR